MSETALILKRIEQDRIKNVYWSSYGLPIVLVSLIKLEFSIKKKNSNIKFHENPSSGSQVVPHGWTDMMKLIVAFRNSVSTSKNKNYIKSEDIKITTTKFAAMVHLAETQFL